MRNQPGEFTQGVLLFVRHILFTEYEDRTEVAKHKNPLVLAFVSDDMPLDTPTTAIPGYIKSLFAHYGLELPPTEARSCVVPAKVSSWEN